MINQVFNADCLPAIREMKDNQFDLAIVDPPYGIGFGEFNRTNKADNGERYKADKYKNSKWDITIPNDDYFIELQRISTNQIVWGGNYFPYLWSNGCKGFIFWYKGNPVPNFADGELAWTSFNVLPKQFDYKYYGNLEGNTKATTRVHPTQKPIALYKWLLKNYAKEGDTIFDSHVGSGSSRIACWEMGFDFKGFEIDKYYWEAQEKRFNLVKNQQTLF